MPDLSVETLEEVFADYMPTTLIPLIRYKGYDNSGNEVEHHYAANWKDITSNGVTYSAAAFKIALISDESDNVPTVTLSYDAGDQQLIAELREYDEAPRIYLQYVIAERPNVIEIPEIEFEATQWVVQASSVSITLRTEPVLEEPIVGDIVTPQIFPFLWENVTVSDQ